VFWSLNEGSDEVRRDRNTEDSLFITQLFFCFLSWPVLLVFADLCTLLRAICSHPTKPEAGLEHRSLPL
jgi:hypothetical protein